MKPCPVSYTKEIGMTHNGTTRALHAAQILWPAFLVAGALEAVVFSQVDPAQLLVGFGHVDAKTVYSLTFLVLWAGTSAAAALSHWMMKSDPEVTDNPLQPARPRVGQTKERRPRSHRAGNHHHA